MRGSRVAPLYGEGRGLKLTVRTIATTCQLVAPLYGEGRGLKHGPKHLTVSRPPRRSSLWRGAWIETWRFHSCRRSAPVAPLYGEGRGLKHCAGPTAGAPPHVAPLYGEGRGLKLSSPSQSPPAANVAPLYGEGRGLKRPGGDHQGGRRIRRSSLWRGAWIETSSG